MYQNRMTLKDLAGWTALLLALAAMFPVSELVAMVRSSVRFTERDMTWSLSRPRNSQHAGALRSFKVKRLEDKSNCLSLVAFTEEYWNLTKDQTSPGMDRFFLSATSPHKPVDFIHHRSSDQRPVEGGKSRCSNFLAHSTRGASSTLTAAVGVSTEAILGFGLTSRVESYSYN